MCSICDNIEKDEELVKNLLLKAMETSLEKALKSNGTVIDRSKYSIEFVKGENNDK